MHNWGPVLYTSLDRRVETNHKQFDMTLMHACTPHGGPDPGNEFRAVFFFTASIPNKKTSSGKRKPSIKADYNDEQMSYEKLLWTFASQLDKSKDTDMEHRESLKFLYRCMGEAIAYTGTSLGIFDKTLPLTMRNDVKAIVSNLAKWSINHFSDQTPENEKEVNQLIDALEQYPIVKFYKKARNENATKPLAKKRKV